MSVEKVGGVSAEKKFRSAATYELCSGLQESPEKHVVQLGNKETWLRRSGGRDRGDASIASWG